MSALKTSQLKPNPAGKDKDRSGRASAAQLGAEWVDVKNTSSARVSLEGVKLYHIAFENGNPARWEVVFAFTGGLDAGKVVRVHSGSGPQSALRPEDVTGADYHLFRDADVYVWNNAEGDKSRLTSTTNGSEEETDKAGYSPNPPEGVALIRVGDSLVPSGAGAYAAAFGSR